MEEKKQGNAFKTVLLVFGIIFSIVLVPGLVLGIPVGGAAVALSQSVSLEGIEEMVKEAKVSEKVHQFVMDEVMKETQNEDMLNKEFFGGLIQDGITVEAVDGIVTEFVRCIYNGSEPQLDMDSIVDVFRDGMDELAENGFDDLYSACFEGTESKYFSELFVANQKATIEQELVSKYSGYGVSSLEELEKVYDAQFGEGAYAKLLDEEMVEFKRGWNDGFDGEIDAMAEDLEVEINDILRETAQDPDVRMLFDTLGELGEKKDTIKLVAYGIVIAAVLLLLVCYWFGTAGFVVPAVALILGGLLCKLMTLLDDTILGLAREAIASEPDAAEFTDVIMNLCRGIITPFFAEMSKFGITAIGIGVVLVLTAILRGVLKKNAAAAEEVM